MSMASVKKNENLTLNCNCLSMSVGLDFNHLFLFIDVQILSLLFLVWEGNYMYTKQEGSFIYIFIAFSCILKLVP